MVDKDVSITVLSDSRAAYGLESEHGFALWIETGGHSILFDAGASPVMTRNADHLGIDLSLADRVALSHGHYDHTGNLSEILSKAPRAELFLHPECMKERYSIHSEPRQIGMGVESAEAVKAMPTLRCNWVTEPVQIAHGVWLTGPIPRETAFEDAGGPFFDDPDGKYADSIPDDQSLWIETDSGIVVCLGCCHSGVINTLRYITKVSRRKSIFAVVGGMHLQHSDRSRLEKTTDELGLFGLTHIYPCHCTGDAAVEILAEKFGASIKPGYAGLRVMIGKEFWG
jgi:7,8-dihydropterin-6-yl-methyl-4-(beta-D-ribofuranosyl)aminobenzene 5'-phosphate synthase